MDGDRVVASDDTASLRATYLRWCEQTGTEPDTSLDITPHRGDARAVTTAPPRPGGPSATTSDSSLTDAG